MEELKLKDGLLTFLAKCKALTPVFKAAAQKKLGDTEAVQAENSLHRVLRRNAKAGTIVDGISSADAEILLSWIVSKTKDALVNSVSRSDATKGDGEAKDVSKMSDAEKMECLQRVGGLCGFGQSCIGLQSKLLGLETRYLQIEDIDVNSTGRHAFSTVTIPVKQNGKAEYKTFLVDSTFIQFCKTDSEEAPALRWGHSIESMGSAGNLLVKQLCEKGFADLSPENARMYLEGQTYIKQGERYIPVTIKDDVLKKYEKNTCTSDFGVTEMVDGLNIDFRTPGMVKRGIHQRRIKDICRARGIVERPEEGYKNTQARSLGPTSK